MPGAVILAVDDTPSHLRLLRNLITSVGGQVFEAESAEMARVQLMRVSPDVILLDIDMPGMDGLTFCRELKANPSLSHTPVIFLSGTADDFDKVEAFLSGGADFIGKPFHPADVLARVSHHVKMVRAQQALKEEKEILSKLNEQLVMAHQETADVFGVLAEQIRGKLIGGKYHLEARIGSGGFSVVYRADEVVTGNKVAVKILRPGNPQGAAMRVQRFAQEASSCMRIQHLNVIKILDSATTPDGFTYLVMELLEGHPLSEEIRRGYPLSLQRSLEIILPVCDVLLAAHNVGVLHRDIKPSKIVPVDNHRMAFRGRLRKRGGTHLARQTDFTDSTATVRRACRPNTQTGFDCVGTNPNRARDRVRSPIESLRHICRHGIGFIRWILSHASE